MARRFITFAAVCVVAWLVFGGDGEGGGVKDDGRQGKGDAMAVLSDKDVVYSARYAVRKCLQVKDSAGFPSWPDASYRVIDLGNDAYIASGRVTAKNAFGVKIREIWKVRLRFTGRELETVNVSTVAIGGEIIYNAP